MKKLLFFIDALAGGGAEKSLLSLLKNLDPKKYEIELLVAKKGEVYDDMVPDFVKFTVIHPNYSLTSRIKFKINKALYYPKRRNITQNFWQSFKKEIPECNGTYDVAIAWGQNFPTLYVAEKVQADKKYAWVNNDYSKIKAVFDYDRPFYAKYDKVVGITDHVKNIMKKYIDDAKLTQISNIIEVGDVEEKAQEESPIDFNKQIFNLVSAGRLNHQKAFDKSLKAAKILKDKGLHFHWTIIGEGSERKNLEALQKSLDIEEEVSLAGFFKNPYPIMKQADLYVQTSGFEGLGRTLVEAKILKKPIVSTNFGSAYGIIDENKTGLIVEHTPEDIAHSIIKLYENKELLKQMNKSLENINMNNIPAIIEKFDRLMTE